MGLAIIVIFVFLVLYIAHFYWNVSKYPEGPFPLPFIGNLLQFPAENIHVFYDDLAKIYGPCFTIWTPQPSIVLTDYEHIKDAFVTQGDTFTYRSHLPPETLFQPHDHTGLMLTDGDDWKLQRKTALKILKSFGLGKNLMEEQVIGSIREMLDQIGQIKDKRVVDLFWPIQLCVGNIINETLFGFHYKHEDCGKFQTFVKVIDTHMKSLRTRSALLVAAFPWLRNVPVVGEIGYHFMRRNIDLDTGRPDHPDPGHPDPGHPDPGHPDPGHPDPGHPDPGHPDLGHPDPDHPDPGHPDQGHPDPGHPDPGHPDLGHPDPGHPNSGHPDPGHPDLGHPDPGHPNSGHPDSGHPDLGHPDPDHPDPGHPDQGHPDPGHPDSGHPDLGHPDPGHPVRDTRIQVTWTQYHNFMEQEVVSQIKIYNQEEEPTNFVHAYMREMEISGKPGLNPTNLCASVVDFWLARMETTSNSIRWSIAYMMKYPEVQDKVRKEILENVGTSRLPSIEDKPNLPYTQAVIHEIQRHSNMVPMLGSHKNIKDTTILGKPVPAGTFIFAQLWSVMKNDSVFEDSHLFNPDRYLHSNGETFRKDVIERTIPFSIGKRNCIGEELRVYLNIKY
ncbi:unnamed protein product [Caenorhabditis nigoni]